MKTAIAFGVFDGLHAGHRAVLSETLGYKRTAVTFLHPPKLADNGGGLLMTYPCRERALKALGMDKVVCLDLKDYKCMSPIDFLNLIKQKFDVALIACGENFKFGKNALGDVLLLKDFCKENGIILSLVPPQKENGAVISSSLIRNLIAGGDIALANKYLYMPYNFTSKVIRGDMRGRKLGFPTINQEIPKELILPKCGVYASLVIIDKKEYPAVSNIGVRPTYKTDHIAAETHIIGYFGDLYGREVTVFLKKYLRGEQRFNTKDDLIKAIKNDISEVIK